MNLDDYGKLKKWIEQSIEAHTAELFGAGLKSTDPDVRQQAHRLQVLRDARSKLVELAQQSEG